jgi:hypothetical protein
MSVKSKREAGRETVVAVIECQSRRCRALVYAASPQGWCASIVAGEQGAACLLIPLQAVQKRAKTGPVLDG